jgi:hypothetical protein
MVRRAGTLQSAARQGVLRTDFKICRAALAPDDDVRLHVGGNMRKSAELFLARLGVTLALAFLASYVLLGR